MKFSATLLSLAALASAATIAKRDDYYGGGGSSGGLTATVSPSLAPLCTKAVTDVVCQFAPLQLTAGGCVDVNQPCAVHPPTSFTARLDQATASSCRVVVYPDFGCQGRSPVGSNVLSSTADSSCTDAPFFQSAVNGGLLSGPSLLPFGFRSATLVCN